MLNKMNGFKRYFCYELIHGKPIPILFYDKPTDGNDNVLISNYKQFQEVPIQHYNLGVTQLSLIYPYQEEESKDEKFKI